jgi:hypothetical protein
VFLGPPSTGKTHLAIGLSIRACQAGHRVASSTATEWVDRLAAATTTTTGCIIATGRVMERRYPGCCIAAPARCACCRERCSFGDGVRLAQNVTT